MQRNALFVTARYKSLGETYSLARFAAGLRRKDWNVHFLAFDFAAGFLRQQGLPVTVLVEDMNENRRIFEGALRANPPEIIFTPDYMLLCFKEMLEVWSNRWLFDVGCPVVTFDHLGFHPAKRSIYLALHKRLQSLPLEMLMAHSSRVQAPGSANNPVPRRLKSTYYEIGDLPSEIVGLIRSCPIHDPRPEPDPRIFRFSAVVQEEDGGGSRASVRDELGVAAGESLVLVPMSSWAVQLCRDFDIPHYGYYPRVLVRYFERFPGAVRILFLSSEVGERRETHGRVTVEFHCGLPFDRMSEVTRAADLVLTDNVASALLGRAVIYGVPAAALVSSVEAVSTEGRVSFAAPFQLTSFMGGILTEIETRSPGSVFPCSVFPMGWREEMARIFQGNLYASTFERLEMFDEEETRKKLEQLLGDRACAEDLRARQSEYRFAVKRLPDAGTVADAILRRTPIEVRA